MWVQEIQTEIFPAGDYPPSSLSSRYLFIFNRNFRGLSKTCKGSLWGCNPGNWHLQEEMRPQQDYCSRMQLHDVSYSLNVKCLPQPNVLLAGGAVWGILGLAGVRINFDCQLDTT